MKSEVKLWISCLHEAGSTFSVHTLHDEAYALSRIEAEGMAFLTITLPRFEKDFLQSLDHGRVSSNSFLGFKRKRGLPAFLSGFLSRIFDVDGILKSNVNPQLVKAVRQVLLLLSKVEYRVSENRNRRAIAAYIATDESLPELSEDFLSKFKEAAESLLGDYLRCVESRIWFRDWIPRHSGGQLATRETSNGRWSNTTWTDRLQAIIPYWDDLLTFPSESPDDITVLARDQEPSALLVLVPKTMKSPRVIVEEPCHMQYVQQGIFHVMSEVLREREFLELHKSFSWDTQDHNRLYAKIGSIDGSLATIDLNEASDRVSLQLVEQLLAGSRFLRDLVLACRSETVRLPNGKVHHLNKFASMGSSLCFPIESMIFYVIAEMAEASVRAIVPSNKRLRPTGRVRIYGDDIIVPTEVAHNALGLLEAYGLKVNVEKTYYTGYFRESCGSDWYAGSDVSVFRLRHPLPRKARQSELIRSTIEFHNTVYYSGWFLVAEYVRKCLLDIVPFIPRVPLGTRAHALWSWEGPYVVRTSPTLHTIQYKVLKFREVKPKDRLDGYGALKKSFINLGNEIDVDHLERAGRSQCVGYSIGWYAS